MIIYPFGKASIISKYLLVLSDSKGKNVMNKVLSLKISITLKKPVILPLQPQTKYMDH